MFRQISTHNFLVDRVSAGKVGQVRYEYVSVDGMGLENLQYWIHCLAPFQPPSATYCVCVSVRVGVRASRRVG
jgi:hypothetical protein